MDSKESQLFATKANSANNHIQIPRAVSCALCFDSYYLDNLENGMVAIGKNRFLPKTMFRSVIFPTIKRSAAWGQSRAYVVPMDTKSINSIVWMDLEMTGLEIDKDTILEASCILTDSQLKIVAEGPSVIIKQPDSVLSNMNDWCTKHHEETGLTQASRKSEISLEKAEALLIDFLQQHIPPKTCPLAGNSVYMDRLFLKKYMPKLNDYMHYRIIDVSSIKELCRRWNPSVYAQAPKKKLVHRSLDDIKESIEELKYYKKFMFTNAKVS